MGESPQTDRRSLLDVVLPRFAEPISREFYRFAGKLMVFVVAMMLAMNALTGLSLDVHGIDPDAYWRIQIPNTIALGTSLVASLYLWRRARTLVTMRRLVLASALGQAVSVVIGLWGFGSVNSHMLVAAIVVIMIYRVAFDFRTGATVFLVLVLGHCAVVAAELAGAIPPQPMMAGSGSDYVYGGASRQLAAMAFLISMYMTAFVVANWAVARLRHKDRAIRILREALAASESGKVGRHSGRTLGDSYEVGAVIAAGGMGEVYRGHHVRTRRAVAIKILHAHLVDDDQLLRRFRREAEIAGALGSRNIVEVIDVDVDEGQPYLVLELLEGEDLMARIARAPLPPALVADVIDQLAEGLAVAHEAGVVHRDLKPENVFLVDEPGGPLVKILDFGVSKIKTGATALTQEVALLGTPDFMAPEQAVGVTEEVGAAADVFAVGGIAYIALTGRRPFAGASVPAVLRRICDEEPIPARELRPELPAAVDDVLAIAMAKDPGERYADARDLAADLRAAIEERLDDTVRRRAAAVRRAAPASRSAVGDVTVNVSAPTAAVHPDAVSDTLPRGYEDEPSSGAG